MTLTEDYGNTTMTKRKQRILQQAAGCIEILRKFSTGTKCHCMGKAIKGLVRKKERTLVYRRLGRNKTISKIKRAPLDKS